MKCSQLRTFQTRQDAEVWLKTKRFLRAVYGLEHLGEYQCRDCAFWHLSRRRGHRDRLRPDLKNRGEIRRELLGAVLSWNRAPNHLWRWADGVEDIIPDYRLRHPGHFALDGWPLDPDSRSRLVMYVAPEDERAVMAWQARLLRFLKASAVAAWEWILWSKREETI